MITLKYKVSFELSPILDKFMRQWNCVFRTAYNKLFDGINITEVIRKCKLLNNVDLLDATWIEFAANKAKWLINSQKELGRNEKVIFGSRKNFFKRKYNKISKEEYKSNRLLSIYAIGRAGDGGNRKVKLNFIKDNSVEFRIDRYTKFTFKLPKIYDQHHINLLTEIEKKASHCEESITYGFDGENILISFDEKVIQVPEYKQVKNRVLSIDQNPNYTGIVVSDFNAETHEQTIIHKEIISIKELNNLGQNNYKTNKRKFEMHEITKRIVNLAKHFQCESIGIEKLEIKSKEHNKGRAFNRCVNTWDRNRFRNSLSKWCNILRIKLIEVVAQYSSFVGCINNPNDIDSIAAAIELGRRSYLFNRIYVRKDMEKQDIVFPVLDHSYLSTQWKEMVSNVKGALNWKKLYETAKNMKFSYRFLVSDDKFLRLSHRKSKSGIYFPDLSIA
jgi:IS605 OrfB family transposase